ncbi:hypothetical protein EKD04_024220 [Chloroflexales bacterium ZM16-3]|nr:hypothetical protein [Chloroflexales bacterium ZM16-3]
MEQEIDLRPYIIAVLQRWRLILSCALILMVAGITITAIPKQRSSASADVLIVPSTSQVTLDPRFQTTNGSQASNPTTQRQALVNLASSSIIAGKVLKELGESSGSDGIDPTQSLINQVSVSSTSDLLQITVSDPDPARALKIAEAWGQAYEGLVADIYTSSQFRTDLLDSELEAAQQRYDSAQRSLETFLSSGQIIQVKNQVGQLNDLLSGSNQAQQTLYTDYLTRTGQLDLILEDAQTLRDQASAQGTSSFAQNFAALLLRARTVDSAALTFQLNAGDLSSGEATTGSATVDLDQLISVISERRDQLRDQANQIASAIASNTGTTTGIDATTRQGYIDQLAALNSTYEQLRAQQDLLTQQRDLARDTLMLVARKRDEQQVARSSPQIEVRYVSANLDPKPSLVSRALLSGIAAGAIGLVLGVILALLLDVIIPAMRRLTLPAPMQPASRSDAPSDRPILGD